MYTDFQRKALRVSCVSLEMVINCLSHFGCLVDQQAISELLCTFVSKQAFVKNLSYENKFDLHENEAVSRTHFHINGFVQTLVLKQR